MRIHLYSTDISVFELVKRLSTQERVEVGTLIVPQNRLGSDKVQRLTEHAKAVKINIIV